VLAVSPGDLAERGGLDRAMLDGIRDTFAFATSGWESSAITMTTAGHVANVSFVTTVDEHRRRGLARAVLVAALEAARERGETAATLQATPMGLGVYRRLGFAEIGVWQEWVPRSDGAESSGGAMT
jgi:GNAT superfamily N-acetyltransferase